MRVEWAIPCKYAEVNAGLATIIGGPLNTFFVPALPAQVGAWLALALAFGDEEAGQEHDILVELRGPDMAEIGRLDGSLTTGDPNPAKTAGWENNGIEITIIQFQAEAEGAHTIDIYIAGRHQKTLPFSVRLA